MSKYSKKKFIKKIPIIDEKSFPEARGKRLRQVRNLANLSRKQLCENSGVNIHSLKGWEIGRYGGLPLDGAEKVIKRVTKEGVNCSLEWLTSGIGAGPQVNVDFCRITADDVSTDDTLNQIMDDEKQLICKELVLFRKLFRNVVELQVADDGMNPVYQDGDYVAGLRKCGDEVKSALDLDCIVQMTDGKFLFRKLRMGAEENKYNLVCTNLSTGLKEPVIYNAEIASVAPVIRHYKRK